MKAPKIDRNYLFASLTKDLWVPAFGQVPDINLVVSPHDAVACGTDPILVERYAVLRQLEAVFKKARNADQPIPQSLIQDALVKRVQTESEMRNWSLPRDAETLRIFEEAKHMCHTILPPLEHVWSDIFEGCGFGPGAIFHSRGINGRSLLEKIAGGVHTCTPMLKSLIIPVLKDFFPNWVEVLKEGATLTVTDGNRLSFVHKDRSKCRTIAVEPSMNVFVQKGIGSYLMSQLRRTCGIDLWDQGKNRSLAFEGSISGACATIDLSDASDRIPRGLVEFLLPKDWLALLEAARSPKTRLPDGSWVENWAFSSQGNGFTFPLETLIFYTLIESSRQAGSKKYSTCYGDDIIVPSCDYDRVVSTLSAAGAKVNLDKSFHEGSFRESCGADYLNGTWVRPVYYKDDATSYSMIAGLHNLLIERWGDSKLVHTLQYLKSLVPSDKYLSGPRRFYTSQESVHLVNTVSTPYTSYFWDLDWYKSASVHYCTDIQTFTYEFSEWGFRNVPLPRKLVESFSIDGRLLAFLYSGEAFDASPTSKPCVRKRKLSLREI